MSILKFLPNTDYMKIRLFVIFNLFLMDLFLFGCRTSPTVNGGKASFFSFKKSSPPSMEKALVLYASDDPIWLPYFSNSFTRRITEDGIFEAIQNRSLNREWMANSVGNNEEVNVDERLSILTNNLKGEYKKGNFKKSRKIVLATMKEASSLLSNNPSSVSFSYAKLAFWAAALSIDSPQLARNPALIYEKYATFSLKDALESLVDAKTVEKIKSLTSFSIANQKTIKVLNSKNCTVFVNGQELKITTVAIPAKMQSVISASCHNGFFSQTFTPERQASIKISPYLPSSFYHMPNPSALPKEQVLATRASAVILIYWSHSGKYMDSLVIEPKSFTVVKKTRISLSTKKDLDEAGDNLIAFLKAASNEIPKTSSSRLTSAAN